MAAEIVSAGGPRRKDGEEWCQLSSEGRAGVCGTDEGEWAAGASGVGGSVRGDMGATAWRVRGDSTLGRWGEAGREAVPNFQETAGASFLPGRGRPWKTAGGAGDQHSGRVAGGELCGEDLGVRRQRGAAEQVGEEPPTCLSLAGWKPVCVFLIKAVQWYLCTGCGTDFGLLPPKLLIEFTEEALMCLKLSRTPVMPSWRLNAQGVPHCGWHRKGAPWPV